VTTLYPIGTYYSSYFLNIFIFLPSMEPCKNQKMNLLFNKGKHVLKYKIIDSYYNVQYAYCFDWNPNLFYYLFKIKIKVSDELLIFIYHSTYI